MNEYLRDNLRVRISTDTEFDYYDSYPVVRVSIHLIDPENGEWEEIDWDSDSISIPG